MPGQGIAPAPRRIAAGPRAPCGRGRRRFQTSFRRALFRAFRRLGFRQSSFRPIARIPRHAAPDAWARPPVCWHATVPFTFRIPGKPSDPKTPPPVHARYTGDTASAPRGAVEATGRDPQVKTPAPGLETGSHPSLSRRHGQPAPTLARHAPGRQTQATVRQQPRPATTRSGPGFSRRGDHPLGV
jgi:hypothetical protein